MKRQGKGYEKAVKADTLRDLEISLRLLRNIPTLAAASFDTSVKREEMLAAINYTYQKQIDSFVSKLCNCLEMKLGDAILYYLSTQLKRKSDAEVG